MSRTDSNIAPKEPNIQPLKEEAFDPHRGLIILL
jgi:hypothetical protein